MGEALMPAVELMRRGAARHGGRRAVVAGAESMTFSEVDGAANRLAHVLAGLGAERGARVGLLVDNGLWSVPIDFACLTAGVARVPRGAVPARLAGYKVPKEVHVIDALPLSPVGEVLRRRALRDPLWGRS